MAAVGQEVAEMKEGQYTNGAGTNGAPLAQTQTNMSMLPPHGGAFMPGPYKKKQFREFANPAPLGLSAFALTTFILSLVNIGSRGVHTNSIVLGCAYAYGGLVQLLAGMWEMAVGNTFGATALSSYGGFWISFAIIIAGGNQSYGIAAAYSTPGTPTEVATKHLSSALGFYLTGWWIFTTILLLCTLRSTVAFFSLFFTLDLAFLFLSIAHFQTEEGGAPGKNLTIAGGVFGMMAAFLAWYNALAGLLDAKNSWFAVPVLHFPWSETGKQKKVEKSAV
ncbi:hypothetical protein H072_7462 [Dactylellina haptotyla CBS 200.50]|uniref:Uncharacterized protein n=1 Tax=Dactylellina haptotyla (strain CBS 200.50) TaxID=1284197 RepID=S8ACI0_DACHA|nr:hypothetical protein H072_7462 [Dactylellina haptotyla CBS 200.50]